ncbi:serine/threonine-protein kinase [Umezawaea sp.]|uniref:serine/threonine-protein kinase n=1 Tax=Umezawaea sp. TaxID=1955258 RepID=UPI002ED5FBA3
MTSRSEATAVWDGDQSGKVIGGRYELGGLLGTGGMAEVYRARDVRLDRSVAIKLFLSGATPEDQIRLDREAQMLAALHTPGVVTVFDTGSHRGRPYYVMQVVDGGTLRQRMRHPLPPSLVARIGAQVADTLDFVHAWGIVHRDIKPSNILLDDTGRQAYLADFGLALQAHATRVTRSGLLVGTAGYLAPEQLRGREVAPPTDIYALGLVLLECLTGQAEYPGGDTEAALARLSRPARVPAGLPEPWTEVLVSMTHSDPSRRPRAAQCAELLRAAQAASVGVPPLTDIKAAFDDEPTSSTPITKRAPARVGVVLAGAVAAALIAVAVALATTTKDEDPGDLPGSGGSGGAKQSTETVTVVKPPPGSRRQPPPGCPPLPEGVEPPPPLPNGSPPPCPPPRSDAVAPQS